MDHVSTQNAAGRISSGLSRRPLVGFTICYLLGTWLGLNTSVALTRIFAAAGISWLAAVACYLVQRTRIVAGGRVKTAVGVMLAVILGLCAALSAWSAAGLDAVKRSARPEIMGLINAEPVRVEVVGVVISDPDARTLANRKTVRVFQFRVERFNGRQPASRGQGVAAKVWWYGWEKRDGPAYGERWSFSGTMELRDDVGIGGGRGPGACLTTGSGRSRLMSDGHGNWFLTRCYAVRRAVAACLAIGIESRKTAVGLIHALLLGYRGRLPSDVRSVFLSTGTLHIFAISGLHVGIIALVLVLALKAMRISRVYWVCWLAPLLIAYTCATGARPSAVRACIMAIVYFLAPLLKRKADIFSSLAFAALVIVIAEPLQVLDVGFVYSFVVMVGLITLYPLFERRMRWLWEPDPFAAPALQDGTALPPVEMKLLRFTVRIPRSAILMFRRRSVRYVCGLAAVSSATWLASAPLTAFFFGRTTPIAIISNLVVIPMAFLIVLTGCLSLVAGSCFVWFAVVFNHVNVALVWVLTGWTRLMAGVPFGDMAVSRPQVWMVFAWYAVLGVIALRCWRARRADASET